MDIKRLINASKKRDDKIKSLFFISMIIDSDIDIRERRLIARDGRSILDDESNSAAPHFFNDFYYGFYRIV